MDAEQLSILRRLKTSVAGVLRLNIITAVLYISFTIIVAMWKHGVLEGNGILLIIQYVLVTIYLGSNPILYILLMSDLRREYGKLFFRCVRFSVTNDVARTTSI